LACKVEEIGIGFEPASLYCYTVGYNIIHSRKHLSSAKQLATEVPKAEQLELEIPAEQSVQPQKLTSA
jgi:hypothetical protein